MRIAIVDYLINCFAAEALMMVDDFAANQNEP
jgi:hypothetical protein